jgi:hypothetical protein
MPMPLTCPSCGNETQFLIKTAQVHVVRVEDGRVEVAEETRPTVFEVLCDRCDAEMDLDSCDEALRKELLLNLGAA